MCVPTMLGFNTLTPDVVVSVCHILLAGNLVK